MVTGFVLLEVVILAVNQEQEVEYEESAEYPLVVAAQPLRQEIALIAGGPRLLGPGGRRSERQPGARVREKNRPRPTGLSDDALVTLFDVVAVVLCVTAALGFLNRRFFGLPTAIGLMVGGLGMSLALVAVGRFHLLFLDRAESLVGALRFDTLLMSWMLSFLLFAGALNTDVHRLLERRGTILTLAIGGTLLSTAAIGGALHLALGAVGIALSLPVALVWGALISPTDLVAVIAIMGEADAPEALRTVVTGESLVNDGVGVVLYAVALGALASPTLPGAGQITLFFLREALGGAAWGMLLGFAALEALRRVDDYTVEILITLAVVTGGYACAQWAHVSGPLAMVAAGLFIGSRGRRLGMSAETRRHMDTFWLVVDEILNAVLFVVMGFEILLLDMEPGFAVAAAVAVALSVGARFLAVGVPLSILRRFRPVAPYSIRVMTWSGLRGGIAIALALGIPERPERDLLVFMTYAVVVFSILVQGLTVRPLLRRAFAAAVG